MSSIFIRIISVILSVIMSASSVSTLSAAVPPENEGGKTSQSVVDYLDSVSNKTMLREPITDDDMLTCKGKIFVNQKGEQVNLRGTNLGGWMLQEQWMCPFENADGQYGIVETLTERFGAEKAQKLIDEYEDNWITDEDFDIIESLGFNCVRMPFWYRDLQTDDEGTWKLNENGDIDFSRLDYVVEQCAKRGIYVFLDLHGAVGFQGNNDHCGKLNSSEYFERNAKGEKFRQMTADLWKKVAQHFNGNPAVAGYDLLNEPMCDFTIMDYPLDWENYDMLYDAVRSVDSEHIIAMCCTWQYFCLPHPALYGWKNVTYEMHIYVSSILLYLPAILQTILTFKNVPVYMAEFKPTKSASWDFVLGAYNSLNYSWTTWSYKGIGGGGDWFIVNTYNSKRADIENDSFETIEEKWSSKYLGTSENFYIEDVAVTQSKYALK